MQDELYLLIKHNKILYVKSAKNGNIYHLFIGKIELSLITIGNC